jgi:hypothetical protein
VVKEETDKTIFKGDFGGVLKSDSPPIIMVTFYSNR